MAAGLESATVLLQVTIDVHGRVGDAEVLEPAGHGFDEAALDAAQDHLFTPAMRGGEPVPVRVRMRIEFRRPDAGAAGDLSSAAVSSESIPGGPGPGDPAPVEEVSNTLDPDRTSQVVEVEVRGISAAQRLMRSAEAVQVVELSKDHQRTADLGEVLARTSGVGVQRAAGLGSDTRFSLNGLTDDQIRFFMDGVPLEFMGYPFGLGNVPVNLVQRVEIYRGVVPIRFGADALGGAVNLVSDEAPAPGSHGEASLQLGSFGTARLALHARHLDVPSGWFTRAGAFSDVAENDYPMDVEVPDSSGREVPARVYRFHDGYRAVGGNIETGVADRSWADRLTLRAFATRYDKEIQHNLFMTFNPYGDVELSELNVGGLFRYEQGFFGRGAVVAVVGYSLRDTSYSDVGECVYDWFGRCIRERTQPGERLGRAQDQEYREHSAYGRLNLRWLLHADHRLSLSVSPTLSRRSGKEHRLPNPDARDPLSAERALYGLVSGLEYQLNLFERRFENVLFAKDYLQGQRSEDPLSSGAGFRRRDRSTHRLGFGDSLRYAFFDSIYAKASYEWATRLPRADEIFGNAFPIQPNLELGPELSHNYNLGVTVEGLSTPVGELRSDLNGFMRDADDLIVLVGDDQAAAYQNVYSARSLGVEAALGWTSPREYFSLGGTLTYVDFRNTSDEGAFASYEGDRIPNRPYVLASGTSRFQLREVAAAKDELALIWTVRHVHSFFRAWEGVGSDKLEVPGQLLHGLALTYAVDGDPAKFSVTGEGHNITDSQAFDFFGVPKPGRAFYFKATASL